MANHGACYDLAQSQLKMGQAIGSSKFFTALLMISAVAFVIGMTIFLAEHEFGLLTKLNDALFGGS